MDTQTVLIVVALSCLALIFGLVLFFRGQDTRRRTRRRTRSVAATISKIEVEASAMSSWWTVTAEWSDPQTGQTFTFRSSHLHFPPKHRLGEQITVHFDATMPEHSRMEL